MPQPHIGQPQRIALVAGRDRHVVNFICAQYAEVLRTQADVLRIKRSQRAETVAGEAGVNMLFPGVLVMVSSVLVILGPFILNYLYFGLNM